MSDVLVHQTAVCTGIEKQDLSTETVIGVIEGTPPWPKNGGGGHNDTSNTSWVEYGQSQTVTTDTTWTVGGSIMVYIGNTWDKKGGWKTKLMAGVKYTRSTQTSSTASKGVVLKTYNDPVPGWLGWVVLLIPEFINDPYILKAYDGHALAYVGDTSGNEVTVSLITYGPNMKVDLKEYYLDNPSAPIGGDDTKSSRKLLEGMAANSDSSIRSTFSYDKAGHCSTLIWMPRGSISLMWSNLWKMPTKKARPLLSPLVFSSAAGITRQKPWIRT